MPMKPKPICFLCKNVRYDSRKYHFIGKRKLTNAQVHICGDCAKDRCDIEVANHIRISPKVKGWSYAQ